MMVHEKSDIEAIPVCSSHEFDQTYPYTYPWEKPASDLPFTQDIPYGILSIGNSSEPSIDPFTRLVGPTMPSPSQNLHERYRTPNHL